MTRPVRQRKQCVDCTAEGIHTKRKAPHPGPRCVTHHRAKRRQRRDYNHGEHILAQYGITTDEYWTIYAHQGNRCYICQRATGLRKKLSVDHDHTNGLVRGLLCHPCNRNLGHLRDDPEGFERAAKYLREPPAVKALGREAIVPRDGAPVKWKDQT